jgi:hypothetical protein
MTHIGDRKDTSAPIVLHAYPTIVKSSIHTTVARTLVAASGWAHWHIIILRFHLMDAKSR